MIINIPIDVEKIINKLEENGFEAYAVGGCVRDSLLGNIPEDWDICTSAKPEQTAYCFKEYKVIETGLKHGTITIIINHRTYEITTYRVDGEYLDNRRPENVKFVNTIREDLSRRDFTINAMAYNSKKGLRDYYGGCCDLSSSIVNCVGVADERFNEDALRIMRAMRFASVLDFNIEKETAESIHNNKELLSSIAKERIRTELCKLICGAGAKRVLLDYSDIITVIIPEIADMIGFNQNNPHHYIDVWQHTLEALENSTNEVVVRLALLLHDIGKPQCYVCDEQGIGHFYGHGEYSADIARKVLRNLKFDNITISNVCELVKYHDAELSVKNNFIRKWLNKIGEEQFKRLLHIKYADIMGQSQYKREEKLEKLKTVFTNMNLILEEKQCYSLKDLAIDGNDLIAMGINGGKEIGECLNLLLEQVIEGQLANDKSILIKELESVDKFQHKF